MNVSFRQLRLFLALVETGSVTGAAARSYVTQPTASMQLKELSENIGEPLFEVISKKVHLTAAGEQLAKSAQAMMDEWQSFEQEMALMKGLTKGRLRVAAVSTAKYFIPQMLGDFYKQHPDIEIAFEVLNRDGVVQRLERNQDDLYIMSMPPSHLEIDDAIFMSNPIAIIAAKNHPLTKRRDLELKDLKQEKFVMRERGSGTRMTVDAYFRKKHFFPNIRLELGTNEAVRNSVAANLGIAALSMHSLGDSINREIAILKLRDFPLISHWHIVTLKGKKLSPLAESFKAHLGNYAKQK
ncbi:LysR family transcriptional regulator [Polynucleobacter acidiphobus]|uniref:LysR family transcriptional regulator n=1 Tax=Polynucleobacter acidiphobus TaxID=556053 RepID=UPI000D3B88B2|nr:LysR family transcriptional regulator [Polynucleobacter acidiphobus]